MLNRHLKEFGINPYLGQLIGLIAFLGLSILIFHNLDTAKFIYPFLSLSFLFGLGETSRNDFLKSIFSTKDYRKTRLFENILLSFPFYLFLLYQGHLLIAHGLLLAAAGMTLFNVGTGYNFTIPTPFYKEPFEFTVGFRKSFAICFLAYGLVAIGISVDNFNLAMFALVIVYLNSMSYHYVAEGEYYIWIFALSPKVFLFRKIKTAFFYSTLLALPIAIALGVFYSEFIVIILAAMGFGFAYVVAVMLAKYSVFPKEINLPQLLMLMGGLFLPPFLLVAIPFFYTKSLQKLNLILK